MELYDLEADWAEKKDVSGEYPEVVQKLNDKLDAWKKTLPVVPRKDCLSTARK